jgi:glycosyltransferase involved in cell wall biosynthesis
LPFAENQISADVKELAVEQPLVLFLGRISWKKGLERLLDAFALTDLQRLAIVGPDDERLVPSLALRARELQIINRVRFLPRTVIGPDKEYLYRAASVFVLPSHSENFGNSVLEAMQRGVPVVITPEVGVIDIVRNSGGGLVTEGSPQALSAAICRLTADRSFGKAMGRAGQKYSANYTWNDIAARMENLYEELSR